MTRTSETEASFQRDLQAVDDLNAGFWTPDYIERQRASTLARHAEYDARFQRMIDEVRAIEPHSKKWVRDLLERLEKPGCLSGTLEFIETVEVLARTGVTGANHVFEHDRRHIAATYLPAKTKETTR